MFDRLLGPKTDHADPKVRARAFAHEALEQAALNQALQTEQDADVLCVILSRADEVGAILAHADGSDGSIANEARTRLVALTRTDTNTSAEDWACVYRAAFENGWSQARALIDALRPEPGREHVVQGALESLPDTHEVTEPVLLTLATQSASAYVRRLAARRLTSREVLEACSQQLKDKDKTVYRELKERLDLFRREDEARELAGKLSDDCSTLAGQTIMAQPEAVAVAQARFQTLAQRVGELQEQTPDIAAPLVSTFEGIRGPFERTLQQARDQVEQRKALKEQLAAIPTQLAASTPDRAPVSPTDLDALADAWTKLADHTDFEAAAFERSLDSARTLVEKVMRDHGVVEQLTERLDGWEQQVESVAPTNLLKQVANFWDSAEKPQNDEHKAVLQQRVDALMTTLRQREQQLEKQRATNSKQMLVILEDFEAAMTRGEFKKAMSLNDKLRARAANRELESGARRRIDEALKKAQPKLDEFRKWRHFGTQQARETLIGQANRLASDPPSSPKKLASEVKELREAWRKLDRDDGRASEAQWQTFSNACKEAYKPAKKHFDQLAKERKKNLAERRTVIERLESLLSDTDWQSPDWATVTKTQRDLMAQWRRTGTVDYKVRKELDSAYESVIARLDEQLADERDNELRRRRRLIDHLKSLRDSETGGKLASAAKKAQRDWRPAVQSDRKTEQALWEEFRGICDEIFGTLKQQQKETKAAWQADASEREQLCEAISSLLADADDSDDHDDRRTANLASGQLDEMAKRWRQRHQIPASVFSKLEARYKRARKTAQSRIASLVRRDEERALARLDTLLDHCQRAEDALLCGEFDVDVFSADAAQFEALKGAVGKSLRQRFEYVLQGMNGDESVGETLLASHAGNLALRQELCLLGELVADLESPNYAENERMALKMKRLTEAMQGELSEPQEELERIANQWYAAGGVAAADWPELRQRFADVCAARRDSV